MPLSTRGSVRHSLGSLDSPESGATAVFAVVLDLGCLVYETNVP